MSQPVIDLEHLLRMAGGDPDLADEVLGLFRHQAELWVRLLDTSAERSAWADAAHTIKGAALGIGANRLADLCKDAETMGRAEQAPSKTEAAVKLAEVRDEVRRTLDACSKVSYALSRPGLRASKASNS